MKDAAGRNIDYLRISITDRCNLRCAYCMPEDGPWASPPYRLLSLREILLVVRAAVALGVEHIRLTGGEPLVRPDLPLIISGVRDLGISDISLTTNGTLLAPAASTLKEAGLCRVNISLDSLRPEVFRSMTRTGELRDTLAGIRAAISAGLAPVKINAVVLAGVNEAEVQELARLSLLLPVQVRFIEVMPIGPDPEANGRTFVPMEEIKARVATIGLLEPARSTAGAGPAETFRLRGAPGTVGFIAPLSHPFCASCNRLRLTPDGRLRPCLASDVEVDLLQALRGKLLAPEEESFTGFNATEDAMAHDLEAAFRRALELKPKGHDLWSRQAHSRRMCQIGG